MLPVTLPRIPPENVDTPEEFMLPSMSPTKLGAVMIPVVFTFPVSASIDNPFPVRGSRPTCSE